MVVDFSKINLKERPMLVLKTQSDEVIQTLGYAFNVEADLMYNEVSTLTFDLPAYVSGVKTPNYDEVKGTRIIDFVGVGLFILVDPTTENDGVSEIKHCKAYSLEYEFTKKQFYIAGNEEDPDEDGNVGYKMVYNFYDGVSGASNTDTIIGRIHEKMPEWTFDVDPTLIGKYRTFDSDVSDNVYNFIKSTVQQTYGCIFNFDTYNRTVTVISTDSVVAQRRVYLSQENLIKKIDIDEDSDSVVTSLDVSGEEGVSIRFVNPTGQNNIYDLHYFLDELPASLRTKWNEWTAACESKRQNYFNLAMSYQVKIADILTEEAKLVDLQGELDTAIALQGAEVSKPDAKQSNINAAKAAVETATANVNTQKTIVNQKAAEKNSILSSLQSINYSLAWEPVRDKNGNIIGGPWKDSHNQAFTANELKILRRYFFEDSVEDSSFALATTNSYTNKDVSSDLRKITINISSSKIERASSSSPMYSFTSGNISVGGNPNYVSAKIIRGTAEIDPSSKRIILTAYLERGDYSQTGFDVEGNGRTIFDCGTITLTGNYTTMTYNGASTPDGIYSGTSLIFNESTVKVYFTTNTSEFEQYSVEWDLFNYGKEILEERSEPSYTFSVESGNFLVIDDFFQFQDDLKLGDRVYLNLDGTKKTPYVTSVHVNYEDLSDFKIEFCNTYRASDSSFRLSQLLEQSIRLGKTLNIKGGMYSQFQATGAQNAVKEFMNSALDIAKNNVLSSENQAITFDESGLRLRKWKDKEAGTYEDEQIWMNDNTIAFTDDNWSTAKMAIGKIIDTNVFGYVKTEDKKRDTEKTYYVKQANGTYIEWTGSSAWNTNLYEKGYAYGIAAPYLVGTVLAGSNLIITTDDQVFKIDGDGILIQTNKLRIINNKHNTVTFEQSLEEVRDEALSESGTRLRDLMQAMDTDDDMNVFPIGYSDALPTYAGGARNGDLILYRDKPDNRDKTISVEPGTLQSGFLYRITMSGTKIASLEKIQDAALADAVESALSFQNTVDGKSVVYARPTPPGSGQNESHMIEEADDGDLWICTLEVGESGEHNLVMGGTYRGGKMYRWNWDEDVSANRKWILVEDPGINKLGLTMQNLMQVLDPGDTDMNLFWMNQNDSFATITAGAQNQDLLYFAGTSNKKITISSGSFTLEPDTLYRITVQDNKITKLTKEPDETKEAIKSAKNFQNFTDGKSTIYAQPDPPLEDNSGVALDLEDDGDLWICTRPTDGDGSSGTSSKVEGGTYYGGKMYRWNWDKSVPSKRKWVLVEDPDIKRFTETQEKYGNTIRDLMLSFDALDNKINVFQKDSVPTVSGDNLQANDLFVNTGTSDITVTVGGHTRTLKRNHLYRAIFENGNLSDWQEVTDDGEIINAIIAASNAQDLLDGKAVIYYQNTIPPIDPNSKGDLWYNSATKPIYGYAPGQWYYNNGSAWVEFRDVELDERVNRTEKVLDIIYKSPEGGSGKYLVAEIINGTISATHTNMTAADGNIDYNNYGMFFKNDDDSDIPKAIWMNEEGFLFGHEAQTGETDSDYMSNTAASLNVKMGLTNKKWYWTTAISHEGITAQALAGKTITGATITGGTTLQIGEFKYNNAVKYRFKVDKNGQIFAGTTNGTDYNFKVDSSGNVIAKNGTFTGTIRGDSGYFKGTLWAKNIVTSDGSESMLNSSGQFKGEYLELMGIKIKDANGNVAIDLSGSGIKFNTGAISWSSINTAGSNIAYKSDIPDEQDLSDYAKKTYVDNLVNNLDIPTYAFEGSGDNMRIKSSYLNDRVIMAPNIIGGTIYATKNGSYIEVTENSMSFVNSSGIEYIVIESTSSTNSHGKIMGFDSLSITAPDIYLSGNIRFNGKVYGLEATATFG